MLEVIGGLIGLLLFIYGMQILVETIVRKMDE